MFVQCWIILPYLRFQISPSVLMTVTTHSHAGLEKGSDAPSSGRLEVDQETVARFAEKCLKGNDSGDVELIEERIINFKTLWIEEKVFTLKWSLPSTIYTHSDSWPSSSSGSYGTAWMGLTRTDRMAWKNQNFQRNYGLLSRD